MVKAAKSKTLKAKKKTSPARSKKTRPAAKVRAHTGTKLSPEATIWQSELKSLLNKSYRNVESAVDDIVESVLSRMYPRTAAPKAAHIYLREILLSDPELVEKLHCDLRIKRR